MNTLTPNRILQEGDEYQKNGTWMPVPENDYGLQIQFTKYGEVRRPSEKPFPAPNGSSNESQPVPTHAKAQTTEGAKGGDRTHSAAGNPISKVEILPDIGHPDYKPISPHSDSDSRPQGQKSVAAKAEKEKTPAPTPSGAGGPPYEAVRLMQEKHIAEVNQQERDRDIIARIPLPCNRPVTNEEQAALNREIETQPKLKPAPNATRITFPKSTPGMQPIWTGRNGTFSGYGLEAMRVNDNVMLSPIGKRGIGNCCIQFPVSVIPQIVEWLQKQTPKT